MAKQREEDLFADTTMTFGEHLEELRLALMKALIALVIGFLIGLFVANQVVKWIEQPLRSALSRYYADTSKLELQKKYPHQAISQELGDFVIENSLVFEEIFVETKQLARWIEAPSETHPPAAEAGAKTDSPAAHEDVLPPPDRDALKKIRIWRTAQTRITTLSPHESFMIWIKAAFVSGLIIASPYMFYQIWAFVAAGLYVHEKKFVHIYLPFSILLFIAGAATAFFFVFGPVLDFLFGFSRAMNIDLDLRISEVIGFVLILPLGFGISFQLPLVMLFLNRIGVFSVEAYLAKWRISVLAIFVISMVLTPADPVSMLLMAVPLSVLYFLGVGLCHWMPRSRNPFAEAYEP